MFPPQIESPEKTPTPAQLTPPIEFDKKLVAHGMRSLASSILNEEDINPDVIEAALAHTGKNSENVSLIGSKGLKLVVS